MWKNTGIIILSKIFYFFIRFFSLGAGSTWPGEIALILNPHFIKEILRSSSIKIIIVAGTNGKTTTASLLKFILESHGKKVIHNAEGANLLNGIASSLIKSCNILGRLDYQVAIFEVDENVFPLVLEVCQPDVVILLNLFRDQLDRYGEVNIIAEKWHQALKKLPAKTKIFFNADDPQIRYLAKDLKGDIYYFGLCQKKMRVKKLGDDVDSVYCPACGEKLDYMAISFSHLGDYHCRQCGFNRGKPATINNLKISPKIKGIYNQYNISACFLVSRVLYSFSEKDIISSIEKFSPAFGRQEKIKINNREIIFLLSKNPAGFNQSIKTTIEIFSGEKPNMLLILNDRIPDGKDISWIWDVDFENLVDFTDSVFVSGDRAYDLALRLFYTDNVLGKIKLVTDNINKAIQKTIRLTPKDGKIIILATYSAMLEARQILTGRKFL